MDSSDSSVPSGYTQTIGSPSLKSIGDRSKQLAFAKGLQKYVAPPLHELRTWLNMFKDYAKVLNYANVKQIQFLPPTPGKLLGLEHGIALTPDYLFHPQEAHGGLRAFQVRLPCLLPASQEAAGGACDSQEDRG